MAKRTDSSNGGRVTAREVLAAVERVHGRVDEVYGRIEDAHERIDHVVQGQGKVTVALVELRSCVNDQLHAIADRVDTLEAPWRLIGRGPAWFIAGIGAAAATVPVATRWPW